ELAALQFQATNRRAEDHFPAPALDFRFATVVKIRKRHSRHADVVAGAVDQKGFPEDIDAEACVGAVELFVESADENNSPKAFDRAFGLAAAAKPFQHGDAACFMKFRGIPFVLDDVEHGARDGELV